MRPGTGGLSFFQQQILYFAAAVVVLVLGIGIPSMWWVSEILQDQTETSLRSELLQDSAKFYSRLGKRWMDFESQCSKPTPTTIGWKNFQRGTIRSSDRSPPRKIDLGPEEFRFSLKSRGRFCRASLVSWDFWNLLASNGGDTSQFTLFVDPSQPSPVLNKQAVLQPNLVRTIEDTLRKPTKAGDLTLLQLESRDGVGYWAMGIVINPYYSSNRAILMKSVPKWTVYRKNLAAFLWLLAGETVVVTLATLLFMLGTNQVEQDFRRFQRFLKLLAGGQSARAPILALREFREISLFVRRFLRAIPESPSTTLPDSRFEEEVKHEAGTLYVPNSLPPRSSDPVAIGSSEYVPLNPPSPNPKLVFTQFSTESPTKQSPIPSNDSHLEIEFIEQTRSFMKTYVNAIMVNPKLVSKGDLETEPLQMNPAEELSLATKFAQRIEPVQSEWELAQKTCQHLGEIAKNLERKLKACWIGFDEDRGTWMIHRLGDKAPSKLLQNWTTELESLKHAPLIQRYGDRFQNFLSRFMAGEGFEVIEPDAAPVRTFLVTSEISRHLTFFLMQASPNDFVSDEIWLSYEKILKSAWARCLANSLLNRKVA